MEERFSLKTPIGWLEAILEGGNVVAVNWVRQGEPTCPGTEEGQRLFSQLRRYFEGRLRHPEFPVRFRSGTAYQRRIWRAMMEIGPGQTESYADLAQRAGGSARSVGMACASNPVPLIVPCHRIVGTRNLGGYSFGPGGSASLAIKRWLLAHEAATV